jgi:pilus assembly protein CpaE
MTEQHFSDTPAHPAIQAGLAAAQAAPQAMIYLNDRDSEGVVRQVLSDLGVNASHFGPGGINGAITDLARRASPQLLVVDISGVEDPVKRINELADVCEPGTGVIVTGESNDIILYRELKAAGIFEYFFKPLSGAVVSRACNAVLTGNVEQRALRTGRLIFTLGVRGGAGATTIASRLAWHLAQVRKRRVGFLDLDLRTGDAALQFDVSANHALREALEHPERIDELFLERGVVRVTEKLELLASEEPLEYIPTYSEDALLTLLDRLLHSYRYVFVDLNSFDAAHLPRVLHLPNLCLLISDGSLASARDVARWRTFIGPNTAERTTLHILNKSDAPGNLAMDDLVRAIGQAPDITVPFDRDVAQLSNLGVRRIEESRSFLRALGPALRYISGEPVEESHSLLERLFG